PLRTQQLPGPLLCTPQVHGSPCPLPYLRCTRVGQPGGVCQGHGPVGRPCSLPLMDACVTLPPAAARSRRRAPANALLSTGPCLSHTGQVHVPCPGPYDRGLGLFPSNTFNLSAPFVA